MFSVTAIDATSVLVLILYPWPAQLKNIFIAFLNVFPIIAKQLLCREFLFVFVASENMLKIFILSNYESPETVSADLMATR